MLMHMNPLNLCGTRKRTTLHRFSDNLVIMEKITPQVAKKLQEEYKKRGQATFNSYNDFYIQPSNLLLFGKIDITDKNDIKVIKKSENKIWDALTGCHFVYSDLNYNTGLVHYNYDRHSYEGYSTFNLITWIKYNLLLLGNPENVVIYKIPRDYFINNCPKILTR